MHVERKWIDVMFRRALTVVVATSVVVLGLSPVSAQASSAVAPAGTPTATHFNGLRYVGAVFRHGLTQAHGCSGSVIRSPRRNLVLTAAHCVSGTGAGLQFAPGYHDGKTPYGVWTVKRAWVSPTWVKSQDPHDDYAFLEVATAKSGKRLEDVTNSGPMLGVAVSSGVEVTDVAYPHGIDDKPVTCTTKIVHTRGYPTFNCHGYYGGTSGSPFLLKKKGTFTRVVGLIGGLYQGGCHEWNSFSSPFSSRTEATYLRAARGERADVVPGAGSSGC